MGKDRSTTGKRTSPASYLWAAAIAAIIGFAAVYWTMAPSDNGGGDIESPPAPAADLNPKAGNEGATAKPSDADKLNTGHMATFVFKSQPEPVAEISFKDGEGRAMTLGDFKGKTILLNLWATWCGPCREEMPALDRLQAQLGGDAFQVLALSVDRGGAQKSQEFLDQINIKNLRLYADESASATGPLKIIGMPTTLLIDAQGREIGRLVGPAEWDSADALRLVKAHIR